MTKWLKGKRKALEKANNGREKAKEKKNKPIELKRDELTQVQDEGVGKLKKNEN